MSSWLQDCDSKHRQHGSSLSSAAELPTRCFEILDSTYPPELHLSELEKGERGRYIALSHRWGERDDRFLAKRGSIANRRKEFLFNTLPKKFQDATHVAQRLGIKYVWINLLCKIQDSEEDWSSKSQQMEQYYASSFLTIASTSAKDWQLSLFSLRTNKEAARLSDTLADLYVSSAPNDFEADIERGALNQRVGVFQERALPPSDNPLYCDISVLGVRICDSLRKSGNNIPKFKHAKRLSFPKGGHEAS